MKCVTDVTQKYCVTDVTQFVFVSLQWHKCVTDVTQKCCVTDVTQFACVKIDIGEVSCNYRGVAEVITWNWGHYVDLRLFMHKTLKILLYIIFPEEEVETIFDSNYQGNYWQGKITTKNVETFPKIQNPTSKLKCWTISLLSQGHYTI